MAEDLVTQVSPEFSGSGMTLGDDSESMIDYNSQIHLNIRDFNGQVITNLTEDDVVFVNFDPSCFKYILRAFGDAQQDLNEISAISLQVSGSSRLDSAASVLQSKPAIIVLREDLDYYVVPPVKNCTHNDMKHWKFEVCQQLLENTSVFSGLGYDVNASPSKEQALGVAEQHLFDMLCTSGFDKNEIWGSRSMEPGKCGVQSLLLVRLVTTPPTPPESPSLHPVSSNTSRSRSRIVSLASSATRVALRSLSRARKLAEANQTKLLLFWRKPARKCWWSNQEMPVSTKGLALADSGATVDVKIHVRRVWTLELSVVGVQ